MIKAITLLEPWPWAFLLPEGLPGLNRPVPGIAPKRVENRTWAPPRDAIGNLIALHAGLGYDKLGAEWIEATFTTPPPLHDIERSGLITTVNGKRTGTIFAVARLAGCVDMHHQDWVKIPEARSYWAFGPYCWLLTDFLPIQPVPCRGMQGLFPLPDDVLPVVLKRMGEAQVARETGRGAR